MNRRERLARRNRRLERTQQRLEEKGQPYAVLELVSRGAAPSCCIQCRGLMIGDGLRLLPHRCDTRGITIFDVMDLYTGEATQHLHALKLSTADPKQERPDTDGTKRR